MKNGLYALASLDGRPLDPQVLATMGLAETSPQRVADDGCVLLARDVRAAAAQVRAHPTGFDALLGYLDEPEDVAATLGLSTDTDPLTLAVAMFERDGEHAPAALLGMWTLVRWHAPSATLTILMAEQVRDTCYVTTDGARVALSPELARLARLDWVDPTPDLRGTLLALGTAQLRCNIGNTTFLRGVVRVLPGTCVTVRAHAMRSTVFRRPPAPAVAAIRFEEGMEQLDAILRRIMRQHFAREGDSGFLLSGGLDSSLLALFGSLERGDRRMAFLTSAAPAGSGLPDETAYAGLVARHLDLPMHEVVPPGGANVYLPESRALASIEHPLVSPRHYLDQALLDAGAAMGFASVVDGSSGEMSVTNYAHFRPEARIRSLRHRINQLRQRWRERNVPSRWPDAAFHVRLARNALARMPDDLAALWSEAELSQRRLQPDEAFGFEEAVFKTAGLPSATLDPELREIRPYTDRRLLRAVARMPSAFITHGGLTRAPARALMRGRLPDAITFRTSVMPYSPTYATMLRDQAAAAAMRIPLYRDAGLGAWLDLDWLATALAQAQQTGLHKVAHMHHVQATATAAEFLLWWSTQRR